MKRLALWLALLPGLGCARPSAAPDVSRSGTPPAADSLTVALWRMDDQAGTRVGDSGPFRLDGAAGRAVRRPFGRFGGSFGFRLSNDSFVYVPYNPALDTPRGLTVETWIFPQDFGSYEDTPIASRWSVETQQQSWIFSLAGRRLPASVTSPGPGLHLDLFPDAPAGRLLFAFQPERAAPPQAFVSARALVLGRWTHVAVTYDGDVVRFFVDGELDAQFASSGRIRVSQAPVLIANAFDVRRLTSFEGDLGPQLEDPTPYYAFQGRLDELRISSGPRQDFPTLAPR